MPKKELYINELQRFNQKYGLTNFSIELLSEFDEQYGHAVAYLNNTTTDRDPTQDYIRWISKAASIYFESSIKIRENAQYDLRGFSVHGFLADFERVMEARYQAQHDDNNYPKRPKYNHANPETIINMIKSRQERFDGTLTDLWTDRIKNGYMKVETMRQVTDGEVQALTSGSAGLKNVNAKLTSVVAAYEAMAKVRESRQGFFGFFWKIFNFLKNNREKEYFNKLTEQIEVLKSRSYDIDGIRKNLKTTVFGEKPSEQVEEEVQPSQQKVDVVKQNDPVSAILNPKLTNQFAKNFSFEIAAELPKGKLSTKLLTNVIEANMSDIYNVLKDANNGYDQQIEEGASKQEAMENYALFVFDEVFEIIIQNIEYKNVKDEIVAAQKFTDKLLEEVSPYILNKEELQEFVKGYAVKKSDIILEEVKESANTGYYQQLVKAFGELKKEYGFEREVIEPININNPIADDNDLVPPVSNNQSIQNLNLINKK